jgi:hypothetical protein
MADEQIVWTRQESSTQITMLGLGMIGLFLLGLFPQTIQFFLVNLPLMFEHLGR